MTTKTSTRPPLYGEGSESLSVLLPKGVKPRMRLIAQRRRLSLSQLVTHVLEEYLEAEDVREGAAV